MKFMNGNSKRFWRYYRLVRSNPFSGGQRFIQQIRRMPRSPKWKKILLVLGLAVFLGMGIMGGLIIGYFKNLPKVSELQEYTPSQSTKLYDIKGELIDQFYYIEQRTIIPLNRIPKLMRESIVTVEDDRFYRHAGIDFVSIPRALAANIFHGRMVQGASTITQQLARNLYLSRHKTLPRKIKEMILAFQIEYNYSKDEILEMYLNQIYFGSGAYGIESAARVYFGKKVEELTVPEIALLTGLPKSPNTFSPYLHPDKALERRNFIIGYLAKKNIINKDEEEKARAAPINLIRIEREKSPYFVDDIRKILETRYGSFAVYRGGLKVYTTLDMDIQNKAERALFTGLAEADKLVWAPKGEKPLQAAMLVIDPSNGQVRAMIGGRSFFESTYNRVILAKRQPGSAFKPFIYTSAIECGFTPADIIIDSPTEFFSDGEGREWKPENYDGKFYGPNTLRQALAFSRNVSTVKLLKKIGINTVISTAVRMGIKSPLSPNLSLALGTSEVSLWEMCSAFATFANQGIRAEPYCIIRVEDGNGKVLESHSPHTEETIKPEIAYIMASMLGSVINYGTGKAISDWGFRYPAGGKTGTTDRSTDAWFVGFTSDLVAGIWMGFDDQRYMGKHVTGGSIPAPIWTNFMLNYYKEKKPPAPFIRPENIVEVSIDAETGLLADSDDPKAVKEVFVRGTEPTRSSQKLKAKKTVGGL